MPQRRATVPLPAFIEPMLAVLSPPFDSDRHVFEIKWDGFRSLVFNDAIGGLRLVGRRKTDFTARFPELGVLSKLPAGTVLDGEIVQLKGGKPDFAALLMRERTWFAAARPNAARFPPATFVAFDLLYDRGVSVMQKPLADRSDRLSQTIAGLLGSRVAVSDGHLGGGLALFDQVNEEGLEGVIAKRIDSIYEPGARSGAWVKFKRRQTVVCAIIGYQANTAGGLKSLLLATDVEGQLRFVGKVGSGIGLATQDELRRKFSTLPSRQPIVPCNMRQASWLRPGLFCRVSFAEWTNDHKLRQPVFDAMI